ncbi:hypothetical protein FOMG_08614 [Fusarium oxysporum f. sp. melonis 26406]|nr:hypothetical protein FOMG_08614 [Fusarium oxysporum f. sp. melonis 26406]EXK38159.1 hypothetical protein FOMG_08614 [Fusarium oxysporum f. sp. melonis 26406]EXK38160.1 hypothetical protein FOMG_08614 [Fusarium oxysporum f. sp. melonis 26406]EXK38161.1 hypothetical protein FOMG_08614 [Fusarium oxysporum f. sp. melonis 26406]EXK38162.1 hypothetical protein FOMG_08614 [Fusarium oxysporum f. sp. melonis 26406]
MFVRQVKKKGTGEQVPQNLDRARTAIARVSMIFKEWHRPGWSTLTMPWAVRRELVMDSHGWLWLWSWSGRTADRIASINPWLRCGAEARRRRMHWFAHLAYRLQAQVRNEETRARLVNEAPTSLSLSLSLSLFICTAAPLAQSSQPGITPLLKGFLSPLLLSATRHFDHQHHLLYLMTAYSIYILNYIQVSINDRLDQVRGGGGRVIDHRSIGKKCISVNLRICDG